MAYKRLNFIHCLCVLKELPEHKGNNPKRPQYYYESSLLLLSCQLDIASTIFYGRTGIENVTEEDFITKSEN
jgi:hypothetical protein